MRQRNCGPDGALPSYRNLPLLRERRPRHRYPYVLRIAPLFLRHRLTLIYLRMAAHTQGHQRRIARFNPHPLAERLEVLMRRLCLPFLAAAHSRQHSDEATQFRSAHHSNSTPRRIAAYACPAWRSSENSPSVICVVDVRRTTTSPSGNVTSSHRPNRRAKYSCHTPLSYRLPPPP